MEEDIKILEEICNRPIQDTEGTKRMKQAIENLIKGYRELEEKDKERKTRIGYLETKLFNLRQEVKLLQTHRLRKYMMDNYIEKSKIKEKIEENQKMLNKSKNNVYLYFNIALQELLGDEK